MIAAYRQWVMCTTAESETAFSALANREAQIITLTQGKTEFASPRQTDLSLIIASQRHHYAGCRTYSIRLCTGCSGPLTASGYCIRLLRTAPHSAVMHKSADNEVHRLF